MESLGTGAGLAALGFWLFIAAIIAVTVWDNIREREAQHETLRRIVESGQPIDHELTDKLLSVTDGVPSKDLARDFKVTAIILLFIAPGLAAFGYFLSIAVAEKLFLILLGVSAIVMFLCLAFYVCALVVERWYAEDTAAN